ncbi:FG-GAP-like repeat-containing protein [Streptomyces sp. H34-S4]|nr:FG-GAP-like repeat-containing protein [Streptomyces sp. H34-S4]
MLGVASSAQAAGGYDRCPYGQVCVFSGPVGTGDMKIVKSSLARLGSWDNRISSLVNYSDYTLCVNPEPDYYWEGYSAAFSRERVSFDESQRPDLDDAISSMELLPDAEDCGNFSPYPDWSVGQGPRTRPAPTTAVSAFGDFDGDGRTDLIGRNRYGALWAVTADDRTENLSIGTGWNEMTQLLRHGDYNSDGKEDVCARDKGGILWFYPGLGTGAFGARLSLGGGWNTMNQLASPGDLSGDGRADLLARDGSRRLWLYPGNGAGGFGARKQLPFAWPSDAPIVATGDATADGISDLLRPVGLSQAFVYPGTGTGGLRGPEANMSWDTAERVRVF